MSTRNARPVGSMLAGIARQAGGLTDAEAERFDQVRDRTPAEPMRFDDTPVLKVARVYLRVSTDAQDLERQESVIEGVRAAGYYVAGVYREKASGARPDRPELLRMVADLQPGEVVIAEKIDRISRLPLAEAERLVVAIRDKGARLAVPGVVDLSELAAEAQGVARIVLESVQDMLLRLALQMARDDYEDRRERQRQGIELAKSAGKYRGRRADPKRRAQVIALRRSGHSVTRTAELAGYSPAQVKRIWAEVSKDEAERMAAFQGDALSEADALAAAGQGGA